MSGNGLSRIPYLIEKCDEIASEFIKNGVCSGITFSDLSQALANFLVDNGDPANILLNHIKGGKIELMNKIMSTAATLYFKMNTCWSAEKPLVA